MLTIFSFNKASYIYMVTGIRPIIEQDERGIYYLVFENTEVIRDAISEYSKDTNMHKFLNCYKDIRNSVKSVRIKKNEAFGG